MPLIWKSAQVRDQTVGLGCFLGIDLVKAVEALAVEDEIEGPVASAGSQRRVISKLRCSIE